VPKLTEQLSQKKQNAENILAHMLKLRAELDDIPSQIGTYQAALTLGPKPPIRAQLERRLKQLASSKSEKTELLGRLRTQINGIESECRQAVAEHEHKKAEHNATVKKLDDYQRMSREHDLVVLDKQLEIARLHASDSGSATKQGTVVAPKEKPQLPPKKNDKSAWLAGGHLTDAQHQVLSLQLEHEMQPARIAEYLGISRAAVHQRILAGNRRLEKSFEYGRRAKRRAISGVGID
jgi:predicted DNA-binding protein YlxM (UPF0122 family)